MDRKIGIFGVVAGLLLLAMAMPVSAEIVDLNSQNGGITPTFSMSVASGANTINLSVGTSMADGSMVNVTSNTGYTVKVKDNMQSAKPAGSAGKMVGQAWPSGTWIGTGLTNPLQIAVNGGTYYTFGATDTTIRTGTAEAFLAPLKYKQVVVVTDPVLSGAGETHYIIQMTVTGSAIP